MRAVLSAPSLDPRTVHVLTAENGTAATSFGTFRWRQGAWQWIRGEAWTLDLPAPQHAHSEGLQHAHAHRSHLVE